MPGITTAHRTVNGIALHVAEAGPADGPLVVLLHGFPEFWWGWRRQIEALAAQGFRVVAPDQRGYNLSDKPQGVRAYELDTLVADLEALVRSYGRESCRLVGHDWGGLVAWWAASRRPGLIDRLVILNAPHPAVVGAYMRRHPSQMAKSSYIGFFQIPWLPERMLARDGFSALRRSLRGSSRRGTFSDEDLRAYDAAWAQPGALTGMLNWYRALRHRPSLPDPRVDPPTLVIWGEGDRFLERGLAEASLALCRDGRPLWMPQATHWVHLEEADAVNEALVGFLK
ncbi:MAG TPA: alpha/beta hydrolase [Microvirga sp.]|jgi:pimeloyl-ACP methyl ester carboxylesterase